MDKKLSNLGPFDKSFIPDLPKEQIVESRLSVLIRHTPTDPAILGQAYFEISKRARNLIHEVFEEFEITVPKEISVML